MGVTIHYRGKIDSEGLVQEMTNEVEDFAQSLGWRAQCWNEDWSQPNAARIVGGPGGIRITGHVPLQGIMLLPHKNCEPVSFTFDPRGYLIDAVGMSMIAEGTIMPEEAWVSTKTQFAPIKAHVVIIKLLRYLKKRYIKNLEVDDEGGYWQTGNIQELQRRFDLVGRALDILEAELSTRDRLDREKSAEELARMIERILDQKFGDRHE